MALISRLPLPDQDARLGTAYVVHADQGFNVGLRGCAGTTIRHVEVRVDGEEPVVWSATAGTGATSRSELPLFQDSPGFTTAGAIPTPVSGSSDVDVGTGVVFDTSLPRTLVAYPGSEQPVTMDQYIALSDSQFDC